MIYLCKSKTVAMLLVFSLYIQANILEANGEEGVLSIQATDLLVKIDIEGMLMRPLGTVCTVTGHWSNFRTRNFKEHTWEFIVDEIDGVKVKNDIRFEAGQIKAAAFSKGQLPSLSSNTRWQLRVFETGGIVGYPKEFWKEIGTSVQEKFGYKFLTELVCISCKEMRQVN